MEITQGVRYTLPFVFSQYYINSILDIPCADFNWMKSVDLSRLDYIGADIVIEPIRRNPQQYSFNNISF